MSCLNEKQKMFAKEYMIDLNAKQAAIRAGYSVKTAEQQGSRLLSNAKVKEYIEKEMAKRSTRVGISQDRVIQELARIAFVNIANVVDCETGIVRDDANDDDLAAIKSIKCKRFENDAGCSVENEVTFNDKMRALELLGKHLGMFNKDNQINLVLPIFEGEDDIED